MQKWYSYPPGLGKPWGNYGLTAFALYGMKYLDFKCEKTNWKPGCGCIKCMVKEIDFHAKIYSWATTFSGQEHEWLHVQKFSAGYFAIYENLSKTLRKTASYGITEFWSKSRLEGSIGLSRIEAVKRMWEVRILSAALDNYWLFPPSVQQLISRATQIGKMKFGDPKDECVFVE